MHDLNDPALRARAVRAAQAQAPFDVLLEGGVVADMVTGELRAADVGLVGPLIASVHPPGSRTDAATRIALDGGVIAPGLIDTHLHIESSMVTPRRYAETVVPQGTTTICWDPHELANVMGLDGVRWAIAASRDLPLRVLVFAPSCVPSAPGLELAGADFGPAEMAEMLSWPEIAGVAEVMDMRAVLSNDPRMGGIVGAGRDSGKLVTGHARSLSGGALQGFVASGVESDHEITTGEDVLEKLRAGMAIELRGSHDYVLPGVVAALRGLGHIPPTLSLCTDDVFPDELAEVGGVVDVLRRLAGHGMAPMDALRAATFHAALRLGRRDLGLVAPGRRADLAVFASLDSLTVRHVFADGIEVARDGALTRPIRANTEPLPPNTMKLPAMTAGQFRLAVPRANRARLRVVRKPRFTQWDEIEVPVHDGTAELPAGAVMLAVTHRHGRAAPVPALGVLTEWGTWRGAIATTVAHDSHNLAVFGRDPVDMAAAANALIDCQGGMAVAAGGRVIALLALPVCGLISDAPTAEVAAGLRAVRAAADSIVDWVPPLLTFKTLVGATLACNAGPHVTDRGIGDGTTGELIAGSLVGAV